MWQPWQIARYRAAPSLCTKWPRGANAPPWVGGENIGGSSAMQQVVASAHAAEIRERRAGNRQPFQDHLDANSEIPKLNPKGIP